MCIYIFTYSVYLYLYSIYLPLTPSLSGWPIRAAPCWANKGTDSDDGVTERPSVMGTLWSPARLVLRFPDWSLGPVASSSTQLPPYTHQLSSSDSKPSEVRQDLLRGLTSLSCQCGLWVGRALTDVWAFASKACLDFTS